MFGVPSGLRCKIVKWGQTRSLDFIVWKQNATVKVGKVGPNGTKTHQIMGVGQGQ